MGGGREDEEGGERGGERIKAVPRYRPKHRTSAASYPKIVAAEPAVAAAAAAAAAAVAAVAAAAAAFVGARYWRLYS